jgi:prolyl-tRNA synthetase
MEKAEALAPAGPRPAAAKSLEKTPTPGKSTCADVAEFLGVPLSTTVKSLVLATDVLDTAGNPMGVKIWMLLLRGDHDMNEIKVSKLPGLDGGFRFATQGEIEGHFGSRPGYLGPRNPLLPVIIVADRDVAVMADWIAGANEAGYHMVGMNWGRDLPEPTFVADIRNVVAGDASPDGKGVLAIERGIEVGHVFVLGTKYSKDMNATYLDEGGKPQLLEMGCYGIGITRLPAAAVEQNHDERGIIWPDALAPFTVVVCPIGMDRSPEVKVAAEALYEELLAKGVDVLLDDRGERPGAMFADWELIGVPHRVVISDRGLKEGQLEYQGRRDTAATKVPAAGIADFITGKLAK